MDIPDLVIGFVLGWLFVNLTVYVLRKRGYLLTVFRPDKEYMLIIGLRPNMESPQILYKSSKVKMGGISMGIPPMGIMGSMPKCKDCEIADCVSRDAETKNDCETMRDWKKHR